jgi:hypothetical protein
MLQYYHHCIKDPMEVLPFYRLQDFHIFLPTCVSHHTPQFNLQKCDHMNILDPFCTFMCTFSRDFESCVKSTLLKYMYVCINLLRYFLNKLILSISAISKIESNIHYLSVYIGFKSTNFVIILKLFF